MTIPLEWLWTDDTIMTHIVKQNAERYQDQGINRHEAVNKAYSDYYQLIKIIRRKLEEE